MPLQSRKRLISSVPLLCGCQRPGTPETGGEDNPHQLAGGGIACRYKRSLRVRLALRDEDGGRALLRLPQVRASGCLRSEDADIPGGLLDG